MKNILKLLILILLISCSEIKLDKNRILNIGKKLTQTNFSQFHSNFPDVVTLGDGLKTKMTELQKNASKFGFEIKTHYLIFPSKNTENCTLTVMTDYQNVEIKLRYDAEFDKFHIIGFMTLNKIK